MFFDMKDFNGESSDIDFNPEKVKKIEFSQSLKKDKLDKSLPFTHAQIDKLVF
jgi:hypothetical protein